MLPWPDRAYPASLKHLVRLHFLTLTQQKCSLTTFFDLASDFNYILIKVFSSYAKELTTMDVTTKNVYCLFRVKPSLNLVLEF